MHKSLINFKVNDPKLKQSIASILFLFSFIFSCKLACGAIDNNLDQSYQLLTNLFRTGNIIGKNLIFTYGPLAFLCFPMNIGDNFIIGSFTYGILNLLFISSLFYLFKKLGYFNSSWLHLLLAIIISLIAFSAYYNNLNHLGYISTFIIINLILIHKLSNNDIKLRPFYIYLACIISSLIALVKPAFFFSNCSIILSYYFIENFKKINFLELLKLGLFLILPYLAIWLIFIGNFDYLPTYIRATIEYSIGNSDAMISGIILKFPLFLLSLAIILLTIVLCVDKKLKITFLTIFLAANLVWLKYSLARTDHFIPEYLTLYLYFSCLAIILSQNFKKFLLSILLINLAFICINCCSTYSTNVYQKTDISIYKIVLNNLRINYNFDSLNWISSFNQINNISNSNIKKLQFDQEINKIIGTNTVDSYPTSIVPIYANNLKLHSRPSFQSYVTYTPWLDEHNSKFFKGSNAPKYLLFHNSHYDRNGRFIESIDNKYLLNDEPSTIRAIFNNYEILKIYSNMVLLKHRDLPLNIKNDIQFPDCTIDFNQWYQIDNYTKKMSKDDVLCAKLFINNNLMGSIRRAIYRNAIVYIDYMFSDNSTSTNQLQIRNAINGVWLSPFIVDFKTKPNTNQIFDIVELPKKTDKNLQVHIDNFDGHSILGWWCLKNKELSNNFKSYVVVKDINTLKTDIFELKTISRQDVLDSFNNLKLKTASGIEYIFEHLKPGNYIAGILIIDNIQKYINWSNSNLKLTDSNFIQNQYLVLKSVKALRIHSDSDKYFDKKIKVQFVLENNLLPQ